MKQESTLPASLLILHLETQKIGMHIRTVYLSRETMQEIIFSRPVCAENVPAFAMIHHNQTA